MNRLTVPVAILASTALLATAACGNAEEAEPEATSPEATEPAAEVEVPDVTGATLHTSEGDIEVELLAEEAPLTVTNFVELAEGDGPENPETGEAEFYDGTIFHRVIDSFMIQGGDPTGTGRGGPGYQFEDEFDSGLGFDEPGLLAMANSGPDTNGSQFFITVAPTPHLNGLHTIFGKVADEESMAVVDAIAVTETDDNDRPTNDVVLESVTIKHADD
ncbi:peptidylprolyl isomerase [Nocardiopsis metallicus]|uniref:Peptidyl-prolyl cis-trans isomerase n=1 Tax=Nocardiopsis metallicus TaxID=179819 RepID=A0A840WI79_9ACTN|nr:peptidylprolyl isomerase [Nocardiopsis metallicus]MBB5492711.1 peptidyl-prolyl cis-trans isomerase A (cyclophilin A) [Nocardiopsis metallicus]